MGASVKLIGIDLDGTLLRKDHSVSVRNKTAIVQALDAGIRVYLVTGRPYCFAKYIALGIDKRIQIISANGGIYEVENRCILQELEKHTLCSIVDVLHEYDMKAFFKGYHKFYTHEPYDERFLYDHHNEEYEQAFRVHSQTQLSWDEIKEHANHIVKVLVYHEDAKRFVVARKRIEGIENIEVCDDKDRSFDIMAFQVNKGNSLKRVIEEYGINKNECMVIGDGHNDISMFQMAGICVGMENAEEDVKCYCDYISDDYMQDGVAKAINMFLKGKERRS